MYRPTTFDLIHFPICLRAFVPPAGERKGPRKPPNPQQGPSEYTLIIDTETATDAAQRLRFGVWQLRKHDELVSTGFFLDPKGLTNREQVLLRRYAKLHTMPVITVATFIDDIFYGMAYELRATIVGHNIPFDIARCALRYGPARGKTMRGG
jgi:hypothetical protein